MTATTRWAPADATREDGLRWGREYAAMLTAAPLERNTTSNVWRLERFREAYQRFPELGPEPFRQGVVEALTAAIEAAGQQ